MSKHSKTVEPECLGEAMSILPSISISLTLNGDSPEGNWVILVILNEEIIMQSNWVDGLYWNNDYIFMDLKDPVTAANMADKPLVFILRFLSGKPSKESNNLLNPDNRAGANVDFLPLLLGETSFQTRVNLVDILTRQIQPYSIDVNICCIENHVTYTPLLITMLKVNCLPVVKDGTTYVCSLGLHGLLEPVAVTFGMSLSTPAATRLVWESIAGLGYAAESDYSVPSEDIYVPQDLNIRGNENCRVEYWNLCKRILVDETPLHDRFRLPFYIEVAGIPKTGKIDVRGRYMGFVDGSALLQPGEFGVTVCTKLLFFSEIEILDFEYASPLLELPPMSGKAQQVRETNIVMDEIGHVSYITMRFDVLDPLLPKIRTSALYEMIEVEKPEDAYIVTDNLILKPPPEDKTIDVQKIRKECGALAIHTELNSLACTDSMPMNKSIKRIAANRLLIRIKTMLKQFQPDQCSNIDWQDLVISQHYAARRAVAASFAPQPPPLIVPYHLSAARSRLAGDMQTANILNETSLKISPTHPKSWLVKALRALEKRNDMAAREHLAQGLKIQLNNKYLLWALGGQEFESPSKRVRTEAMFLLAVKRNIENISNVIGWAALHSLYHYSSNYQAAFVAAKTMRKWFELPIDWNHFLDKWKSVSEEEEYFWNPTIIDQRNPFIIASAVFLSLRAYKFSELLLKCHVNHCGTRGSRNNVVNKKISDVYYLRAASFMLRNMMDKALQETMKGIAVNGPTAMMLQMRTTCLLYAGQWDDECEKSLKESERAGSETLPALLLRAALYVIDTNPKMGLQRAARAHKAAPCAQSALVLSRIYLKLYEDELSERWAAAAVKLEPNLADGWAFLATIAIRRKQVDNARALLRTAYQVGSISEDILEEIDHLMTIFPVESLPQHLMKHICYCHFY